MDVDVSLVDGRPTVRVIDSGPGIAAAERERVFGRFYRSQDAPGQARDLAGSGLGLAIVRAIADLHGAAVSLHTPRSGRGLEVQVSFAGPAAA